MDRRNFMSITGTAAGLLALNSRPFLVSAEEKKPKKKAFVKGAFLYPPTAKLDEAGYYSWPGSTFDAEGRHQEYLAAIRSMERRLGIKIQMAEKALDEPESVTRFVNEVKQSNPDGLLLIPLKKSHYTHAVNIVQQVDIPTVVFATLGILLVGHINQLYRKQGVYLINSLDNLDAVEDGLKMIRTACRMKDSRLLSIRGSQNRANIVPHLGTEVRTIPLTRFYDEFERTGTTDEVKKLARYYTTQAKKIVEPTKEDIIDAAKTYFVLKRLVEIEESDAVMMDCLPGLRRPHKHPPPCMGFMSLRDEGIPAGCQADLNATLSLMLVQELCGKPGFQQNASMDTEKNHYFGAHCTCASRLNGIDEPPEPLILRNHAEAGWGCVPRILWRIGQEITITQYVTGESPQMIIYTGNVVGCPSMHRVGGCRTNVELTINEVEDVCDVKGMHQCICYGNYSNELKAFCQLYGIEVVT